MNIDFPLILVILVFGSGFIWLGDSLLFAPRRKRATEALQQKFPRWDEAGSKDQSKYQSAVEASASEPPLVEYSRSFFPVLAVVFVLRSFLYEPFQIPSGSMIPTLEVGDYILVNKYTYGIRLPVIRSKVFDINKPERGDVMVFFPPHKNDTYYIKRVIGLPGDKITYVNKRLYVNDKLVPTKPLYTEPGSRSPVEVSEETLGEETHLMQRNLGIPSKNKSVVVKPGHYFMMGDNRDNSADSRVWGEVPERDIVGKAVAIWMQKEKGFNLPTFERVGAIQ